jgi:hypothetical protein
MKRAVCIVALVSLPAFVGCGGDGDGDGFIAEVDAICTQSARQVNAAFAQGAPTSAQEAAAIDAALVETRQAEVNDLRALEAPEDKAAGYEDFVAARNEILAATQDQLEADRQADQQASQEASAQVAQAFDKADQAAEEIGLQACAGVLPPDEEEEVRAVAEEFFTASTAAELKAACEDATDAYIEQIGGLEQCHEPAEPRTIEIIDVSGVSGVSGEVIFVPTGGPSDGQRLAANFVYREGAWKVDGLGPAPPPADTKAPSSDDLAVPYIFAQGKVNSAIETFKPRVRVDLRAGNLEAVKADAKKLRDVIFNFDAELREFPFPDALEEDVNSLLEANGTVIADLDAIGEATSLTEAEDLIVRFAEDFNSLYEPASAAVQKGLE